MGFPRPDRRTQAFAILRPERAEEDPSGREPPDTELVQLAEARRSICCRRPGDRDGNRHASPSAAEIA